MIIEDFHRFRNALICASGDRYDPVSKIEVSEKVWRKILSDHGDKLNMAVDDTEILSMQFCGIEIIRRSDE